MADRVAEEGMVPLQLTHMLLCVRVEEQLVRVEAMAGVRLVGAVDAIAVDEAGARVRQIAVEHLVGVFGSTMRSSSVVPVWSKMQSSTFVALAENRAKLTPSPSHVAPRGNGRPASTRDLWRPGFARVDAKLEAFG